MRLTLAAAGIACERPTFLTSARTSRLPAVVGDLAGERPVGRHVEVADRVVVGDAIVVVIDARVVEHAVVVAVEEHADARARGRAHRPTSLP